MIISDGTGKGFKAKVNEAKELLVKANAATEEHKAALAGDGFLVSLATATSGSVVPTDSGGYMLYIKNNETDYNVIIQKAVLSSNGEVIVKTQGAPTVGTLGNNTSVTPRNTNTGSSKTLTADAEIWDGSGNGITGLSGGATVASWILDSNIQIVQIDGGLVIAPGGKLALHATAITGTPRLAINLRVYKDPIEV